MPLCHPAATKDRTWPLKAVIVRLKDDKDIIFQKYPTATLNKSTNRERTDKVTCINRPNNGNS